MRKSTKFISFLLILAALSSTLLLASCEKPNMGSGSSVNNTVNNGGDVNVLEGAIYGDGGLLFMPLENDTYGVAAGNAKYQSHITIPETFNGKAVTHIFDGAFSGASNLKTISLPNSITFVGDGAFENCENLEYFEDKYAYYLGNTNNKYLVLVEAKDPTMTSCTLSDNTVAICDKAFQNCKSLIKITAKNVKSVGSYAFWGCSSLTTAIIPKGTTSIGKESFKDCQALTEVTIPATVSVIEESAFENCSALKTVTFETGSVLTKINNSAFYGCKALTKITIPEKVIYIGNQKVNDSSLKSEEDVHGAFENCTSLSTVTFKGKDVNMIGNCAFKKCTALTAITLPDSVSELGSSAFLDCSALTTVKLSTTLTKIKPSTFENCSKLTSIEIKEGILTISGKAFSGCSALSTIEIPKSVTLIGAGAFGGCSKLTSVTMKDSAKWSTIDTLGRKTAVESAKLADKATAADFFINNNDATFQKG